MRKIIFFLIMFLFLLPFDAIQAQNCDNSKLIISQDFNHYNGQSKEYSLTMLNADFPNVSGRTSGEIRGIGPGWPQETRVIDGELRAELPANKASGKEGGFLFDSSFDDVEEAVLEYRLKFNDDFYWAAGGKLPGLGGSSSRGSGAIPSGCVDLGTSNSDNGFSCRLMWRTNRAHTAAPKLVVYTYHPNRPKDCGEDFEFIKPIEKGKWYTIKQYVKLNTPGQQNGILEMYVDGVRLLEKTDMEFRLPGKNNVKINSLIMNTYRGGSRTDPVWFSPTTDYIYFDDVKVWVNCSETNTENQLPLISFKTPNGDITVKEGYSLSVEAEATDPDGTIENVQLFINGMEGRLESVPPYEWGHDTSPEQQELNNLPVGQHEIKVVATDNRGAKSETMFTLTVEEAALSINEINTLKSQITVFPVPFTNSLNISFGKEVVAGVVLYSTTGKKIRHFDLHNRKGLEINTFSLEEGIYFLEIQNVKNQSLVYKVIK